MALRAKVVTGDTLRALRTSAGHAFTTAGKREPLTAQVCVQLLNRRRYRCDGRRRCGHPCVHIHLANKRMHCPVCVRYTVFVGVLDHAVLDVTGDTQDDDSGLVWS